MLRRDDGSGDGGVLVFVGLSGKSYRAEQWRAAPTGNAHVGRKGMHLYDEWVKALRRRWSREMRWKMIRRATRWRTMRR